VRATRFAVVVILIVAGGFTAASSPRRGHRWVYMATKLADDARVEDLLSLMRRAAAARYDGIVLAEFGTPPEDTGFVERVERIRQAAKDLALDIVPAIFPIGDSRRLLAHDPNLAEGLPVRDALFVVHGGVAELAPDPPVRLLEDLSRWDGHDPNVEMDRDAARVDARRGEGKLFRRLAVHPFRQYHVTVEVKTEALDGVPKVVAIGDRKPLDFDDLGVGGSQDWTRVHAVFNSLDHREVTLHLSCSHCRSGTLWWRSPRIEEVGLLNVVRRAGAPLVVRRDGGGRLREGTDFERVVDPRMGAVPSPGRYERWHEAPKIRVHGLADGTRLRVSYYHAVTFGGGKVMICPSEPRTVELLREEARRAHELWRPKAYFMGHDEVRALGWDESCTRRRIGPGAILADNVRTCRQILRKIDPAATVYVWSDMFDPNHNAQRDYYLVNGDLHGAWNGLDRDVVVALWGASVRAQSLAWFASRRQPMLVAGYYDQDPSLLRSWLDAARGLPGIDGVMYTTWRDHYDDLERFAAVIDAERP
jgi:hypothetical protein